MKFLFLVVGLGEFAQAESVANYAEKRGVKCYFGIDKKIADIVKKEGFKFKILLNETQTEDLIKKIKPSVLFLCNSKTSRTLIKKSPSPEILVASLDSNWLFGQTKKYKVYDWIDRIFVVFPQKIFDLGLKENGGFYQIPQKIIKKIYCTGFIPSGNKIAEKIKQETKKKLGLDKDDKLIFGYFGKGPTYRFFLVPKLINALEDLLGRYKIKLFWGGPRLNLKKGFLIFKDNLLTMEFEKILGSSDLVVQHHGLGTLSKVIHNQIPAICYIPKEFKNKPKVFRHSPAYEIEAFEKAGLCRAIPYQAKNDILKKEIVNLLYNKKEIQKMKLKQKQIFKPGEKNLFEEVLGLIEGKK